MAIQHEDNDIPYRSAVDVGPDRQEVTKDEEDYSTLHFIQKEFAKSMEELDKESVFDLTEAELSIKEQIAANRRAKAIIEPLKATIDTAIDTVKAKQRGR